MKRALTLLTAVAGWVAVIQIAAGSVAPVPEFQVQGLASEVVTGAEDVNRVDKSTNLVVRSVVTTTTTLAPPTTLPEASTTTEATTTTLPAAPATTTTTRAPRTATTAPPVPATTAPAPTTTSPPATTAPPAPTGSFSSSAESDFVSRINNLRQSVGVAPLSTHGGLHGYARNWAEHMATSGNFAHSNIGGYIGSTSWSTIGENIGKGGSVGNIFNALVNSASHYNNMVNPSFTHVGVGVYIDAGGTIWTAHVFGG